MNKAAHEQRHLRSRESTLQGAGNRRRNSKGDCVRLGPAAQETWSSERRYHRVLTDPWVREVAERLRHKPLCLPDSTFQALYLLHLVYCTTPRLPDHGNLQNNTHTDSLAIIRFVQLTLSP